jgi:DNA-3-methyladenine glycosylase
VPPHLDPPGPAERRRLRRGLEQPSERAARFLLGQILVRRLAGRMLAARIVETEAYLGQADPAAHAFRGRTRRTEPLWGPAGTVYVYFIYGMHHCLNLSVDAEDVPECVLIRAAEPLAESGLAADACRGPGRLTRTLGIDLRDSGRSVFARDARLYLRAGAAPRRVGVSVRVGITQAADRLLRFYDAESGAVSRSRTRIARGLDFAGRSS